MRTLLCLATITLASCTRSESPSTDTSAASPPVVSAPAPAAVGSPWAVSDSGAGVVRIGMTVAEARAATGGALSLPVTLDARCDYVTVRGAPEGLRFMLNGGQVARAEVGQAGLPTAGGVQVGDPEARVREVYGATVREEPHKYVAGGRYLVVTAADTSRVLLFETEGGVVTRYRAGRQPEVRWVEGCS